MLSEKYQNEQKELETKIRQLHEMMEAAVQTAADAEKWIALISKYHAYHAFQPPSFLLPQLPAQPFLSEAARSHSPACL